MSTFIKKIHQVTGVAHDTIWDAQSWFGSKFSWAADNLQNSWRRLASGFNWWLPLHLVSTVLWLVPLAITTIMATMATTIALSLSVTIDTAKLVTYLADRLIYGAYRVLQGGLSFFSRIFASANKNQLSEQTATIANDIQPSQQSDLQIKPSIYQQDWYKIIDYARWAPSPHNMQPWLFDIQSENQATLMYDPQRLLPDTNPSGSYMFVGFGILFETMSIAAAKLGKNVEVKLADNIELDSKKSGLQQLATLKIIDRESKEVEPLDPQLIMDRRTSRLPYNGRPLTSTVIHELSAVARQYGHTMGYASDDKMVDWVIQLNANAMHADMSNRRTRNELRSWFRYSKTDAVKQADGLAAYAMNSSALELWLFANVNWIFRIPGISHLALSLYKKSMSGTATVAWLSGPFGTRDEWVNAGRMMARWWLTMTKDEVYLHPFGSVITNPEAFKHLNDKVSSEGLDVRSEDDKQKNPVWMLTRNGYGCSEEQPPQAQRMPLEKMIVSSNQWCSLFNAPLESKETTVNHGVMLAP